MANIQDLLSDISSIVTSVHFGEMMTLKRIEEDYISIYGKRIPYNDYGFLSLQELLQKYPDHFQLFINNGILIIRSKLRNNITALISKEKRTNKPKNFATNTKRVQPAITKPIIRSSLVTNHVIKSYSIIKPSQPPITTLDILKSILALKSGFTVPALQQHLYSINQTDQSQFSMVMNDARVKGILSYDHDLIYSSCNRHSVPISPYPSGVSTIIILDINSPSQFIFQITDNPNMPPRTQLHSDMQRLAPSQPLLSMFSDNRYCAVLIDNQWYRSRIIDISRRDTMDVLVRLQDFHLPGVDCRITLPCDRLRFVPPECENVPGYVYGGSLAYVVPTGKQWTDNSRQAMAAMVPVDRSSVCRCFLAGDSGTGVEDTLVVDVVVSTAGGERWSMFQRLVQKGVAKSSLCKV